MVGPRVYEYTDPIAASEVSWESGVSYHTGAQTANETSVAIREVTPFEVTFRNPGPSWVFVAVTTHDEAGEERGFHGLWQNLMVLSGTTFDAVTVSVDGTEYLVEAETNVDGLVTTTVSSVANPEADVDPSLRVKALYTAGVHTQVLDGIFERPAVAELPVMGASASVDVESPSSSALLEQFADRYTGAIKASGLTDALAAKEALSPTDVEDLVLGLSRSASMEYVSLAASWSALQKRISDGESLSFANAHPLFRVRLRRKGDLSSSSGRSGRGGSPGRRVGLAGSWCPGSDRRTRGAGICDDPGEGLREVLEATGTTDLDEMLRLDAEMRATLPAYGLAKDAVLCAVAGADDDNSLFLEGLAIADSSDILMLVGYEQPPATMAAPPPHRLRIIAKLNEDGRIEHGVELSDGEQILPSRRYLSTNTSPGIWRSSSDVEVDGYPIGKIRSRRLDDGRVELGFMDAAGGTITPDIRYLSQISRSGFGFGAERLR